MKISIVYVSQTGNTELAAEYIQDGILGKYPFIQVKPMDIRESEADMEFLDQSDAVIFGTPVYFTGMSWELKKWFDHSFKVNLNGKLGAAFVTANSPTGGTETAIMDVLRHMLAKGMLAKPSPSPQALPIETVNPRLFLALILLYCRSMTREHLASTLMVSPDVLDRVLAGDDTEFRASWETSFSLLVRYLDIPAARKDLESLIQYLRAAEQRARPEILVETVREHLRTALNWDCQLCGPIRSTTEEYDIEDSSDDEDPAAGHGGTVPCVLIPMTVKDCPARLVQVRYFPGITGERGLFGAMAEREARHDPYGSGHDVYRVFAFDKQLSYEHFVDGMCAYHDTMDMQISEDPTRFDEFSLPMSILRVDEETMEIREYRSFE